MQGVGVQHTYADVCRRMQTYADVCRRMQTYSDVCRRMQTYADVCRRMQTYADGSERGARSNRILREKKVQGVGVEETAGAIDVEGYVEIVASSVQAILAARHEKGHITCIYAV